MLSSLWYRYKQFTGYSFTVVIRYLSLLSFHSSSLILSNKKYHLRCKSLISSLFNLFITIIIDTNKYDIITRKLALTGLWGLLKRR